MRSCVKDGFYEIRNSPRHRKFGHIAHVFSTYESRLRADGPVIARGINSIELFYDGKRWWIASNIWDDERPNNPLPAEYLPSEVRELSSNQEEQPNEQPKREHGKFRASSNHFLPSALDAIAQPARNDPTTVPSIASMIPSSGHRATSRKPSPIVSVDW